MNIKLPVAILILVVAIILGIIGAKIGCHILGITFKEYIILRMLVR